MRSQGLSTGLVCSMQKCLSRYQEKSSQLQENFPLGTQDSPSQEDFKNTSDKYLACTYLIAGGWTW